MRDTDHEATLQRHLRERGALDWLLGRQPGETLLAAALRVACEAEAAVVLRAEAERLDDAWQDADHYPGAVARMVEAARATGGGR